MEARRKPLKCNYGHYSWVSPVQSRSREQGASGDRRLREEESNEAFYGDQVLQQPGPAQPFKLASYYAITGN